ncbi:MAG: hypothetical protein KGL48_12285 [Sphingomonadales bacterium]|nr:hypothetical protein [Sphingomonadales bacterium]MDE2569612.1 hypothetical protein [Sphingomonadales bacterium]
MPACLQIDRRAEKFGSAVTIADLAAHSFPDHRSAFANIHDVWEVLERDWSFEIDRDKSEMEYATGVTAHFRDGSVLYIGALAGCCDGSGCRHCTAAALAA